jgi:hypothetical protein
MFRVSKTLKNIKNKEYFHLILKDLKNEKEIKDVLIEMNERNIEPDKNTIEIISLNLNKKIKNDSESNTKRHSKDELRQIFFKKIIK